MLRTHVTLGLLLLCSASGPSLALNATDTMAEWNSASEDERNAVLDALGPTLTRAYSAEKADLLACLNRTGQVSAHSALPVRDVVRTCVAMVEHRDPDADQPDDI